MENKIKWHKPSLIKRLLIKLRIIKDKRYKPMTKGQMFLMDEIGHYPHYIKGVDDWKAKK